MSISSVANTDTFQTWLNTTNIIISTLNANTLVHGVQANGAFAIGNTTDLISSLTIGGNKFSANGQNLVVAVATSLNSNVSIGTSANTFTVATTGNTTLQSTVATVVSSPSLIISANAEFSGRASFANTVQMTGALVTITTANVNTATINTATLNNATVTSLTVANALTYSNTFIVNGATSVGNTLSVSGNTTVSANLSVTGQITGSTTLSVTGAATLSNTLNVTGATTLSNTLTVTGNTTLSRVSISSNVTSAVYFDSTVRIAGATNALSTLGVTGAVNALSTLGVTGATTLSSTLGVAGAATLSNTLAVTGTTTVSSALTAASLTTGGALSVTGAAALNGGLAVTSGAITLANTVIFGSTALSGSDGTMRVAWASGQSYIQSGLNAATGASSNLVFSTIGATDEWMRIEASTKTLKVNGPIEYTKSQALRDWVSRSVNTTYVTDSDGFVVIVADISGGGGGNNLRYTYRTDSSNAPTTIRGYLMLDQTTGPLYNSMMMPVKAGHYWSVTYTVADVGAAPSHTYAIYFVSLGTAGASS
jgi:fibronectin-binding autotransporter adhesin